MNYEDVRDFLNETVVDIFNGIDIETEILDYQEDLFLGNNEVFSPYEFEYFVIKFLKHWFENDNLEQEIKFYLDITPDDFVPLFLANCEIYGLIDNNHFLKEWNKNCNKLLRDWRKSKGIQDGDFGYQYYPKIK